MSKLINSPAPCFIAPTAYLEQFASQSNAHLTLAHLIHGNDGGKYVDFYRRMAERGDLVMNDNSAFELGESFSTYLLLDTAKAVKASVQVLPDYPGQHQSQTINAALDHIDLYKRNGIKTFFVPQAEAGDLEGWIDAYLFAANHPDIDVIGMSILGIPLALPWVDRSIARVVMVSILKDRGIFADDKHHHFLGLNSGPKIEIGSLLKMNALDTFDSSNAVWMGILGHRYASNTDTFLSVSKVSTHVNFDQPASKDNTILDNIQTNIDLTKRLFA